MTRVLQISDPHFGTEQPHVMRALLRFAHDQQPEVTLLTGDITQRARRAQFSAASAFVRQLPEPVLAVPGNHDIPLFNLLARMLNPYGNYKRAFGNELEPEYESDRLLVICLNTSRPSRHKDGEVSSAQIERVARRLREARPEQLRLVMQHHPVRAREKSDLTNLLIGYQTAVPTWVDAGLDLLIGGHIHLPYVWPLHGHQGEAGRRGWTAQAGTALSTRVRAGIPNSVNLIVHDCEHGQHHCRVERWDYNAQEDLFMPAHKNTLVISRQG
ncbi:metallophosphoesterase [Halopseudomonas sp.]|uniref:metallophosphoesterase family protein n=1 Tax=Halopseudomonas sp. TaxID=2901191 RepID=UPI003565D15A